MFDLDASALREMHAFWMHTVHLNRMLDSGCFGIELGISCGVDFSSELVVGVCGEELNSKNHWSMRMRLGAGLSIVSGGAGGEN